MFSIIFLSFVYLFASEFLFPLMFSVLLCVFVVLFRVFKFCLISFSFCRLLLHLVAQSMMVGHFLGLDFFPFISELFFL